MSARDEVPGRISARDEVLGRIRTALGSDRARSGPAAHTHPAAGAAAYRTRGELDSAALLDLLARRLTDYGSKVRRTEPAKLAETVRAALAERGVHRVVLPPGLDLPGLDQPAPGRTGTLDGAELITDNELSALDLDQMDGIISRAAVAIAETGTIILDGGSGQGRRALSLIPDYHLCLVEALDVVALVPEALARLRPVQPLTWISGPSATSDIELDRVEGVHGPRALEVILIS